MKEGKLGGERNENIETKSDFRVVVNVKPA